MHSLGAGRWVHYQENLAIGGARADGRSGEWLTRLSWEIACARACSVYLPTDRGIAENDSRRDKLKHFIRKRREAGDADLAVEGLRYLKQLGRIPDRLGARRRPENHGSSREKEEQSIFPRVTGCIIMETLREDALKRFLMIGTLVFAATAAAETAVAAEFYVVRDATTKKCTIVDTKPTTTTTTIVDNGTFKTKTEAETGMKTMKVCTSN